MLPKRARGSRYVAGNYILYGLKVISRDLKTGRVTGLQLRFCIEFWRESNSSSKHKPTANAFKIDEEREGFFVDHIGAPYVNSMPAHFSYASRGDRALVFNIDASVIENFIGDMTYIEYDEFGSNEDQVEAGSAEADNDDARAAAAEGGELVKYTATIAKSKVKLFKVCVKYVACSTSFRIASNILSAKND
eukprot:IDg3407t1